MGPSATRQGGITRDVPPGWGPSAPAEIPGKNKKTKRSEGMLHTTAALKVHVHALLLSWVGQEI